MFSAVDVVLLSPGDLLDSLTRDERLYAHYMARAAWSGTRIILRQVSPESTTIFDFIVELHRACGGRWPELQERAGVSERDMRKFLEYAALFLQNLGNYFVSDVNR